MSPLKRQKSDREDTLRGIRTMSEKAEKNETLSFLHSQIEQVIKERTKAANEKEWATANSHMLTLEHLLSALDKAQRAQPPAAAEDGK